MVAAHERGRRLQRVEARVGEVVDHAHLLDPGAVDLLDLAHEESSELGVAELDRELVDRHALAALEHVDADDVAVDGTDARRDEAERTGPVGEPHADEDVGDGLDASFTDDGYGRR